jgi:hypothetical protein
MNREAREMTLRNAWVIAVLAIGWSTGAAFCAPAWPLRVDSSGRFLEDQRGAPFLIAADTGWCMVNGLTDGEIDTYLSARRAQGFNAIQFQLMTHHSGCAVGGGSVDRYGHTPFTTGDLDWTNPSEAYWSRVDSILNKLKARDMLALVTPAYLGSGCVFSTEGWCPAMDAQTTQQMAAFGAFIGQRYRNQGNIVWIAGGDANPLDYPGMDGKVDALMSALAAADTSHQLITGHASRHVTAFEAFGAHPWLTLNSAYDGETCPDDSMADQIRTEFQRTPVKPLHSIEQRYDGEGADADCLAAQFLWSALGGGVGQSYGNGLVWNFSSGWNDPGSGINSPIASVHTNSAKLVRSRRFWLFSPDYAHTVVLSGFGSGTSTVATARASDGETVMSFVPDEGTSLTVDMTRIAGTQATAWWFDPISATATSIGSFPTSGTAQFVSPAPSAVLVLDNAALNLPPPGSADIVGTPGGPPGGPTGGSKPAPHRPVHRKGLSPAGVR